MNRMKSLAVAAALSCAMAPAIASAQSFRGSVVRIDQRGDNNGAAATQSGASNSATITQRGADNNGVIRQSGDNNRACLTQRGRGLDATIVQNGNDSINVLQGRDGRVITAERTVVVGRAVYQCR